MYIKVHNTQTHTYNQSCIYTYLCMYVCLNVYFNAVCALKQQQQTIKTCRSISLLQQAPHFIQCLQWCVCVSVCV